MGESGFDNVPKRVGFCCAMQAVILAIGIGISINMSAVGDVAKQNTSTVTAVTTNWSVIPFTEVRVTDDKCNLFEDSMFERQWGGTSPGCLVNKMNFLGYGTEQAIMTNSEYDSYI